MSKKNKESEKFMGKDYENLSDEEFITNVDYLCTPYYQSYMQARSRSIIQKEESLSNVIPANFNKSRNSQFVGAGIRRRKFFLALIAIFMILLIAVTVFGYIGTIVPEYVSTFVKPGNDAITYIGLTDPVFAVLNKFAGLSMDSVFYTECFENIASETNTGNLIAYYGLPFVALLAILFMIITFIIALVALCKKGTRKGYVAKKTGLGFVTLLLFLFSLFIAAAGIIWNGAGFGEIVNFFTLKSTNIYAGYGLYALVGLSLISMIFSWCSYGKKNKNKK